MTAAVSSVLLLPACGQNNTSNGGGESFAAAVEVEANHPEAKDDLESTTATQVSAVPTVSPVVSPTVESSPAVEAVSNKPEPSPELSSDPAAAPSSAPSTFKPSAPPPAVTRGTNKSAAVTGKSPESSAPDTQPTARTASEAKSDGKGAAASPSPKAGSTNPEAPPSETTAALPRVETSSTGKAAIDWNGFFDGSDQTRPSEQFWDLSGSQVTIKGFMGEVLSFEKNWFLLIPEPGAECPFDNGDETYWNKIMIVFVPEGSKLRHTSGPLQITGRLDVGIKIDESGYKTMFRLYDASFKSI